MVSSCGVPKRSPAPRPPTSSGAAPLRVAVVGLGIGRTHLRGLLAAAASSGLPPVQVVALCDRDRARLRAVGREIGVAARYSSIERLLAAERPDAVVVATPNDLHAPMGIAALEAGCHVLVEKPLAHRLDAAEALERAARRARRRLMLDLSVRFGAAARTVKAYLESGRCGRLYHANTYWCRTRGIPFRGAWLTQRRRAGGGPVFDLGVHRIDLALWFMGEPEVVAATAVSHGELGRALARRRRTRFDVEDFGGGLLRLAGGRGLVFEVSWAENSGRREIMLTRVLGVRGGAIHRNVDHGRDFVAELHQDRAGTLVAPDPAPWRRAAVLPVHEFLRAIADPAHVVPDGACGVRLQRVLTAVARSAGEGREVALAELAE
ncbi:MAG: Gfo/Idh/MocA family oxidoreductase [Planctomycetes bacterium]|nr:Gfo/Idh/MocA family oxidoreductase [Planctomycetota bacterium]